MEYYGVRRIIGNRRDQKIVSGIYFALAVGLQARPDAGSLIPYLESTTILNPVSLGILYTWCSGYLWRTANIQLWKYAAAIFPLFVSCFYLMFYMAGNQSSSLVTGIIAISLAILLGSNLQQQVVRVEPNG
jgi:hypothetical protein